MEIYFASTVDYKTKENFSYQENSELVELNKKSPGTVAIINNTYNALIFMNQNAPLQFLFVVSDKDDPAFSVRPKLKDRMEKRMEEIENKNNKQYKKLLVFKDNLNLIKTYAPVRYNNFMDLKYKMIKEGIIKK